MQVAEISSPSLARKFLEVNPLINGNNPNYIQPLNKDIESVFDPEKNKAFRFGEAIRWLLTDETGRLIGRIAAFVNKKYRNMGDEVHVGGIGFFDCIDNQEAASLLFDTARNWLREKGMEAMDGPINFGERDRWWGLVVEGFQPPMYCMNYNPPYYQKLFETYGFRPFYNQICFGMKAREPLAPKLFERHAMYASNPDFQARQIEKKFLDHYAQDFTTVYNKAWAGHGGMKELTVEAVKRMFRNMKPVMDEKIDWFAYYKDEPIAIFINIPDLNQWFKYLKGKFGFWHKLKFLWIKKTVPCRKFSGLVFGVVPEWQGKGIDSYLIVESAKIVQHKTVYTDYEMQWIGEFNPKMINVAEGLGNVQRTRTLITYRYLFDRNRPFKPHPLIS